MFAWYILEKENSSRRAPELGRWQLFEGLCGNAEFIKKETTKVGSNDARQARMGTFFGHMQLNLGVQILRASAAQLFQWFFLTNEIVESFKCFTLWI